VHNVGRAHNHILLPVNGLDSMRSRRGTREHQLIIGIGAATSLLGKVLDVTCLRVGLADYRGLRAATRWRVLVQWLQEVPVLQAP